MNGTEHTWICVQQQSHLAESIMHMAYVLVDYAPHFALTQLLALPEGEMQRQDFEL